MKSNFTDIKTCAPKCRSTQHADELIALITKTSDTQTILSGLLQCHNCHKISDRLGRQLLHVAASCGRTDVCEWLLYYKRADVHARSLESGWTPLHCSAFYGHIDTMMLLLKYGASLAREDNDRLTALEHLAVDKWQQFAPREDVDDDDDDDDDLDVFCWGSNANFNLGNGHDMKKAVPEMNDYFKKHNVSIVQVVMSKFHSAFRAKSGQVFTCGFGTGGRLGHASETTLITPQLVDKLKADKCVHIAASRNNTYFLTADGVVHSCGTNEFKQLGQLGATKASLAPKPITIPKAMRGKRVKQVNTKDS